MKTFKQFVDEAIMTKIKLKDSEHEIGAHPWQDNTKKPAKDEAPRKIPLNRVWLHEPEEKTHPDTAEPESEKNIQNIMSAIKRKETIDPIHVRRQSGGNYQVLDGHHRVEAHKRLGSKHINAYVIRSNKVKEEPWDYRKQNDG